MAISISPLAPVFRPHLPALDGVALAVCNCGLRYTNRPDLLLAVFHPDTNIAGVFTKSLTASAPVEWCRSFIKNGKVGGILINAGNANAFTGKQGVKAVKNCILNVSKILGYPEKTIFPASTGVIGEPLRDELIIKKIPELIPKLSYDAWSDAAHAIMTTDTFPKMATRHAFIGKTKVTINGIAKGSGMIAPDMATMLGLIVTDADIP
ncbi:MAG: bifunctional ornithine acetyltransferase/N-acetylglutamate synthase, partial [Alphaproteobacteria bacterium]|nr:bifunctional ornithine acetyltransferase/N-acetylglutamate synthase [Alphaproteobacteria bacterium]